MAQRTILIADDDLLILQLLTDLLSPLGHRIVTASDGYDATMKAHRENPDLIITDIEMPAGTGPVFYEQLQQFAGTMGKPVIFVSGRHDGAQLIPRGRNVRFVPKPVNVAALLAIVGHFLPAQ
jgi:twitching motility two-component system response regulator PilH